ncbi:hypothetical protein [[Clostridium] colinum]|uniref:hypothetical protein n=1 Tax=[Clostridium] colinum TaxID=36835 RepID=UPI0020251E41|nr:hypothetical protein [[Clostridium] colinum]
MKTLDDFKEPGKVHHITGIVYNLDDQYIYIVEIRLDTRWFQSCGERYKFKHNFTKDEMDNINIGSYIQVFIRSSVKNLEFQKIKIKRAKQSHDYMPIL